MSVTQAVRNPRGYIARTVGMYRALVVSPDVFYDEYLSSRGLKSEILTMAVVGLLGFAGSYYTRGRIETLFPEAGYNIGDDVSFQLWGTALEPLVGIFGLWVGLAVALYAVSWLYSTVGQFYELLKRSAWALVPLAFVNVIHSAAIGYAAFTLSESDLTDLTIPRAPDLRSTMMWTEVAGDVAVVAAVFVSVVFVLWAGYLAAHAVAPVRDLEMSEAYRVAAVPTVAYAGYVVFQAVSLL